MSTLSERDEASLIVAEAQRRQQRRDAGRVPVDYARLNAVVRRQRTALTRAINSGDSAKVVLACRKAVQEWDESGMMWPDDWSRWQRALDDSLGCDSLGWGKSVDLRDLRG